MSVSGISAWLANKIEWINQFGAFGWWSAALLGALCATLTLLAFSSLRLSWHKGSAIRRWKESVDSIDPMLKSFDKKRIDISDVKDPITNSISDKTFTDCDLLGPANLMFSGVINLDRVQFINCDVVPIKDGVWLFNVIEMKDVNVISGRIHRCTLFVSSGSLPDFRKLGVEFVSIATDEVP